MAAWRRLRTELPTLKRSLVSLFGKVRIAWTFYQITSLIPSVYNANLPESIRNILEAVSLVTSVSVDFGTPLECHGLDGFLPTLITWIVGPLVVSLVVWLVGLAWAIRAGCSALTSRTAMRAAAAPVLVDACLRSLPWLLLVLYLLYPSVTSVAFKSFECEDFDDGRSYLRADYSIECLSSDHTPIVVLGAPQRCCWTSCVCIHLRVVQYHAASILRAQVRTV